MDEAMGLSASMTSCFSSAGMTSHGPMDEAIGPWDVMMPVCFFVDRVLVVKSSCVVCRMQQLCFV